MSVGWNWLDSLYGVERMLAILWRAWQMKSQLSEHTYWLFFQDTIGTKLIRKQEHGIKRKKVNIFSTFYIKTSFLQTTELIYFQKDYNFSFFVSISCIWSVNTDKCMPLKKVYEAVQLFDENSFLNLMVIFGRNYLTKFDRTHWN